MYADSFAVSTLQLQPKSSPKKVNFKITKQESHFLAFCNPYTFYFGTKNEIIDFIKRNRVFDSLGEDLGAR
jgi:alkyl hydroperoxide reductase subunit AhpC